VRHSGLAIPIATALLMGCGCSLLRGPEAQINFAADRYASATLLYRVESARPSPTQQSSFSLASVSPSSGGVVQSLAVKYPHPAGRPGYARVELVLEKLTPPGAPDPESKTGWFSSLARMARDNLPGIAFEGNVIAAWGMDLPVNQLDPIVARLRSQGFFTPANSAVREVTLGARVNGVGAEKPWAHVPELDALVIRVRKEGSFVSHKGLIAQSFNAAPALPPTGPAGAPPTMQPVMSPARLPDVPAAQPGMRQAMPPMPPGLQPAMQPAVPPGVLQAMPPALSPGAAPAFRPAMVPVQSALAPPVSPAMSQTMPPNMPPITAPAAAQAFEPLPRVDSTR